MAAPVPRLLLYASPALLNGALLLLLYVKVKNSHYTMIAEGLGFMLGVLLAALVLNLAAGAGALWYRHYWLAASYLTVVVLLTAFFVLLRHG